MKKILFIIPLFISIVAYSQDTIITRNPKNIILCKITNVDIENGNVLFSKDNSTNTYSISQIDYCSNEKVESLIKKRIANAISQRADSINHVFDSIGFHKGSFLMGGNISFSDQVDASQTTSTSLTILPEWIIFTGDKFALVFGVGYTYEENGNSETTSMFDIKFGGRYYFLNLTRRCRIYNDFSLNIGTGSTFSSGIASQNTLNIKFDAGLGLNYFITNKLIIDFRLTDLISYSSTSIAGSTNYQFGLILNRYNSIFNATSLGLIYKL
jgi:outer membrane protein